MALFTFTRYPILAPPYSSLEGFIMNERTSEIIAEVLSCSLRPYKPFMPALHIIIILLMVTVLVYGNSVGRLFTVLIGVDYLLIAFLQNIAMTEKYGLEVITVNIIWLLLLVSSSYEMRKLGEQIIHSISSHYGDTGLYL